MVFVYTQNVKDNSMFISPSSMCVSVLQWCCSPVKASDIDFDCDSVGSVRGTLDQERHCKQTSQRAQSVNAGY